MDSMAYGNISTSTRLKFHLWALQSLTLESMQRILLLQIRGAKAHEDIAIFLMIQRPLTI